MAPLLNNLRAAALSGMLFLWQLLNTAAPADAEILYIAGVPFEVDQVVMVDSQNVRLVMFGQARIISRAVLEHEVASNYLSRPDIESLLSLEQLRRFVINALEEDRVELAYQAFSRLLFDSRGDEAELFNFLEAQRGRKIDRLYRKFFESVSGTRLPDSIAAHMLLAGGLGHEVWLHSRALQHVYRYRSALKTLIEQLLKDYIQHQSWSSITKLLEFERAAFGPEDEHYIATFAAVERFKKFSELLTDSGTGEALQRVVYTILTNHHAASFLHDEVLHTIHEEAARMLVQEKLDKSLFLLLMVPFDRRTPRTHEIVRQAIAAAVTRPARLIFDNNTEQMLERFAHKDPAASELYQAYLEQRIVLYLQGKQRQQASRLIKILLRVRPDPHPQNAEIRLRYAALLRDSGESLADDEIAKDVSRSSLLLEKIKDFLSNFGSWRFLVAAISLLGVLVLMHRFIRTRRAPMQIGGRWKGAVNPQKIDRIGAGKSASYGRESLRSHDPRLIEYQRCLAVFRLPQTADAQAIKKAYRKAVKTCHPDTRKSLDAKASEQFLRFTEAYNKIIELRGEIFSEKIK